MAVSIKLNMIAAALAPVGEVQKKESKAKIGLEFCTRLFNLEDKIKDEPHEVRYTMRQEYAKHVDGRLDNSNNRAEHLAKSFAVCRKNSLFSNTPKGAESRPSKFTPLERNY